MRRMRLSVAAPAGAQTPVGALAIDERPRRSGYSVDIVDLPGCFTEDDNLIFSKSSRPTAYRARNQSLMASASACVYVSCRARTRLFQISLAPSLYSLVTPERR